MKKQDKLFDIDEPPPRGRLVMGHTILADHAERILHYCTNTPLTNFSHEACKPRAHYGVVSDRGPGAIDAPLSRRLARDQDPVEFLRINDHFTSPVNGFPFKLSERATFESNWTVRYQQACGAPQEERRTALQAFYDEFVREISVVAPYVVRKTALCDVGGDGAPVGSTYSSSNPFWQMGPRCRVGEMGPIPSLPSSTQTPWGDGLQECSPRSFLFFINGIQYEVMNHRHNLDLVKSHENCFRLGGHRLKGHSALSRANVAYVHQPPMGTVEYYGFIVCCTGMMPIAKRAPVAYGSRANQRSSSDLYRRSDDQAVAAMRDAAAALNLKGHFCGQGNTRQFLYTNGDLCLQRGIDNRLYVVSGQERLMPPMTTNQRLFHNGYLYRMLRPELVKNSKKSKVTRMPLNSDAFSEFSVTRADEHDREVALITEVLRQQLLVDATNRILQVLLGVESVTAGIERVASRGGIAQMLHCSGVNVRFIGEISTRLSTRYFRLRAQQVSTDGPEMLVPISVLLCILRMEMVTRAMKCFIRRLLRNRSVVKIAHFISGTFRYSGGGGVLKKDEEKAEAPIDSKAEDKKKQKVTLLDPTEQKDDEDEAPTEEDTFQAEDDHMNCFDRSVWPLIESKFGSGEGFTILRFTPNQINVNGQVPYDHTKMVATILQSLAASTGITFAKRKAKWQNEEASEEHLPPDVVADEIVNGVSRQGESADFGCGEPLPVVCMPEIPPVAFASGEFLHMIGVARSMVRTASLAVELQYLFPQRSKNALFLRIVDWCAIYCLDSNLTEDQDVMRWMRFRRDVVKKMMHARQEAIKRSEEETTDTTESEPSTPSASPRGAVEHNNERKCRSMQSYFIRPDTLLFPLLCGNSAAVKDTIELQVNEQLMMTQFGVKHRNVVRIERGNRPPEICIVVGMNKFLYVAHAADAPIKSRDDDESERKTYFFVFALLAESGDALRQQFKMQVVAAEGFLAYYDPMELGVVIADESKNEQNQKSTEEGDSSSDDDGNERRLQCAPERSDCCFFFCDKWEIVEYNTHSTMMNQFIRDIRSGHRILLRSTGATFRVIGVRQEQLWVCQERVDALPRPLLPSEYGSVSMLHLLDKVSYDENVLYFKGRHFQRCLAALNKHTLYYGQKVLLRSGPLAGVVGIILGSEADTIQMINITSKQIVSIPGRSRDDVFHVMSPLLLGCVLDLSVYEPIEPTTYDCITACNLKITLDVRAERLLDTFGVVQGSLVEVLLGPFTLCKTRVLGSYQERLWVTLQVGDDKVEVGKNAIPLRVGEYRVMAEAPISVRDKPNKRLALRQQDNSPDNPNLRLSAPLEPFCFLCATGVPVDYDKHSDVCGVFNLFHGQVVLVAKDVFSKWEPMTVIGVFQGELWVVPDGHAAAVPLDGFSGTELLQNYSIIEVRGHTVVEPFRDYLHMEGFEITPFTVYSRVSRDTVMVHVLQDTGELVGLDKKESSFKEAGPPFAVAFGDRIRHALPENPFFLSTMGTTWKRKREYEYHVLMGVYDGTFYALKDGDLGVHRFAFQEDMEVVGKVDVLPLSANNISVIQQKLRSRRRKSTESDMEQRKQALDDALQLQDTSPFPPPNLPNVDEAHLTERILPMVIDFNFQRFAERFSEARIPDASARLVIHWMLTWFGCGLKFSESRKEGLKKLHAIEEFVVRKPIPFPTMLDYDAYRVRREVHRSKLEQQWGIPAHQMNEWKSEAFAYCVAAKDGQGVNRGLRLLPSLEDHVKRGAVIPALSLPFSEMHKKLAAGEKPVVSTMRRESLQVAKTSRSLLDIALARKKGIEPLPADEHDAEVTQGSDVTESIGEKAWQSGLQQLRRHREAVTAKLMLHGAPKEVATQDASMIHRYKTSEGGLIFIDGSPSACDDVFQMSRGDVYRYTSGDMEGVHVVILGAVEGVLWRYEEKMSSQDKIMDEQARPFLGHNGEAIRNHHPLKLVGKQVPRSCDPFYFPRLDGALVKFNMEEASCSLFGVYHGQRYVIRKENPIIPPLPHCRHGPVVAVIGVYNQNIFFAADGSGAFSVATNSPVDDLQLEPLYSTVVGAFAVERKNWNRCPVEITRRGKSYIVSACFDISPSLMALWDPRLRLGVVLRLPVNEDDIPVWRARLVALHSKKKGKGTIDIPDEMPTTVLGQIVGVRGNQLYRALLHEDFARPLSEAELKQMEILGESSLLEPWDGGPVRLPPQNTIATRAVQHMDQLFQYVDSSGSDSGLMLRPPSKFKCFNTFHELCLYDQTDDEVRPFGVAAFDWVKIFVAQRWKWAVVIGVRHDCLWRIEEEHLGVLKYDLRIVPDGLNAEAVSWAKTFYDEIAAQKGKESAVKVPVTSVFNHCECRADLERNYSLEVIGTCKMRGFIG